MIRKVSLLLVVLVCSLKNTANAQSDTTHVNVGVMMVPMGGITLNESDKGFETSIGVFGVAQFIRGNTVATSFYSMSSNSFGAALYQQFTPKFGAYAVGTKSVLRNNGYAGIGFGIPLASGRATGFVECGSSWQDWSPGIYVGVFVPFVLSIR